MQLRDPRAHDDSASGSRKNLKKRENPPTPGERLLLAQLMQGREKQEPKSSILKEVRAEGIAGGC
ncbi:hypothetical protein KTH_10840 [Thermosporothrix hazakensis]|jgi:hypothetical protein|nr:hypothetical protein KTH_10840 [Thermosporothrix hazakensis]